MSRRIKEEPFVTIINREWRRAKKLLPRLKRKPTLIWLDSTAINYDVHRSGCVGYCNRRSNLIALHEGYKRRTDHKEFVMTLRHEFAHLPKPTQGQRSHGADFKWWLRRLRGTYWSKFYQWELDGLEKPRRRTRRF